MLKCLIAFILGWLVSRMMGNGFSVGGGILYDTGQNIWRKRQCQKGWNGKLFLKSV